MNVFTCCSRSVGVSNWWLEDLWLNRRGYIFSFRGAIKWRVKFIVANNADVFRDIFLFKKANKSLYFSSNSDYISVRNWPVSSYMFPTKPRPNKVSHSSCYIPCWKRNFLQERRPKPWLICLKGTDRIATIGLGRRRMSRLISFVSLSGRRRLRTSK